MVFNNKNKEEFIKIISRLDTIESGYKESIKGIKDFQTAKFNEITELFEELKQKQIFYFEEYEKSIATFNNLNISHKKEFDNLNLIKNNLTEKVLEKIEQDLKEELKKHFAKLDSEKAKFEETTKELETLREEIKRLTVLAEKIKAADLELTQYAQELRNRDDEKTRLLKKIDDLQTLIAKIRRGQHS